jgi:predicted O-methyltransferase YrrM
MYYLHLSIHSTLNPHLKVARKNIEYAGLSDRVEIILGSALDTLPTLGPDHSFDFAFQEE